MLEKAIIQATLPVADLARAKKFYAEKLGLEPVREIEAGLFYECKEGSGFFLFLTGGRPSGQHTQATWLVTDIETTVAEFRRRGVAFEDYDLPGLRTTDGIADLGYERAAWFHDSEGNLLALGQLLSA